MSDLTIEPLLVLAALVAVSFFTGIPLAYYFLQPLTTQTKSNVFVFSYVAILLGYSQLHLLSFLAMQFLGKGMDMVALPVTLASLLVSSWFLAHARERVLPPLKAEAIPLVIFFALLLLATAHVLLPVVLGRWEMAYATGDDAARWYMVVSYFRTHAFDYTQVTGETLRWTMLERPLQNVSGAIIASLFHTRASFAYSVSAASSLVMAVTGFCLVFEGMFGAASQKSRYLLWMVAALFFAAFGSFINIFYTGRTTHHFSMYAVIAALGFVAIQDVGMRRFCWYCLWSSLLAYIYSLRFSANFIGAGIAILFFQLLAKEIGTRAFVKNAAGLVISFFVACLAAWQELLSILETVLAQGGTIVMLPYKYGVAGTLLDRILQWSGFLGTYESHEQLSARMQTGLLTLITLVVLSALIQAAGYFKRSPAYAGLFVFNLVSALALFATQNLFVAWKLSLYWPSFILLGCLAFALNLREHSRTTLRVAGSLLLVVMVVYVSLTARQLSYYGQMVDARDTKVDHVTNQMRLALARDVARHPGDPHGIFGYDFSAERHLLLREIFRDYPWQPIRGTNLYYEHDIAVERPEIINQYRFGYLLYAQTFKAEPIDFSGNDPALVYEHAPFKIFGARSSLLEFRSGIEMQPHGAYDAVRRCWIYGGVITSSKALLVFANNGGHDWLDVGIRIYGKPDLVGAEPREPPFSLAADLPGIQLTLSKQGQTPEYTDYLAKFSELSKIRLLRITITRNDPAARIVVASSKWGYP